MRNPQRLLAVLAFASARWTAAATWTPIGPPGGIVASVAFAPSRPNVAYAAILGGGVFTTTDGGATWKPASSGLPNPRVVSIVVDPADADVAWVGAYRGGETDGGVFETADGGASWKPANSGLTVPQITLLRGDPSAPLTLYAGTVFGGIFRTTDGAASWHDVSSGLVHGATVVALAVDDASNVTASIAENGNGTPAVLRSADGGATWVSVGPGLPASDRVTALAARPGSSTVLLAGTAASGVFRSSDGGASWAPSSGGFPAGHAVASLAFDPADASRVFAGDDHQSVFLSTDGGSSWTAGKAGNPPGVVTAIAVNPSDHSALAGTTDAGIFRSHEGIQWFPSNTGVLAQEIEAVAVDAADEKTIYAAGAVGGLSVTHNAGATWRRIDGGLPESLSSDAAGWTTIGVAAIAVDPSSPATLYAGLNELGPGAPAAGGGLYKSTDGGATWRAMMNGLTDGSFPVFVGHLAIDPSHPSTVYAAAEGHGLFRSTDGASSWAPASGIPFSFLNGVVVNPAAPATVLAVTSQGLYRSTDSGNHFAPSSSGFPDSFAARAFAFDPSHPQRIFAGTFHGEIFTSEDDGASWTPTSSELSPHGITGLAWASGPATLFASTEDAGIFRSADGGAHWSSASDGLTTLRLRTMANRSGSDVVVAGSFGEGVVATGNLPRGRGPILPVPTAEPEPVERPR